MSTYLRLGLDSLNRRLDEVDTILDAAGENFEVNQKLYSALCRSAQVLLSAHFEGYLKDLVKNSLDDINLNSSFKNSNPSLKRKHCEYFVQPQKDDKTLNQKISNLVLEFDELDPKFKKEFLTTYSENANPKATVLDKIAQQYGIKNFFNQLKRSNLDEIFSNTKSENVELRNQIRNNILSCTENYPYTVTLDFLNINDEKVVTDDLWNSFLSNLMKRRHDIAHGRETENVISHSEIFNDRIKLEILIYAFTAFISFNSNPFPLDSNR